MATPDEIIDNARGFAEHQLDLAEMALNNARSWMDAEVGGSVAALGGLASGLTLAGPTSLPQPVDPGPVPPFTPVVPSWPADTGTMDPLDAVPDPLTTVGEAPTFTVVPPTYTPPATPGPLGDFTATPPTYNAPSAPAALSAFSANAPAYVPPTLPDALAAFAATAPTITSPTFPTVPSQITSPSITALSFDVHTSPTKPNFSLPALPGTAPLNDAVQPADLNGTFNTTYAANLASGQTLASSYVDSMIAKHAPGHVAGMLAVEARLATLFEGGTGLAPLVEDAIYSRARSKNNAEALRVRDQAINDMAARGFTLPSGALVSAIQQARQGGADNNARASADIVVQQAELEQKNLQFALSTSVSLRTTVLQMTSSWLQGLVAVNGQALDAAKAVVGVLVEAYNTAVRVYSVRLDAWKAEVAMYETNIRASLAKVELYKAEVTALQAEYSVDMIKVERLKAEIMELQAYADVFKTQVQATVSQAELEKLKIEVFGSQTQAYVAQVQAKNAEWQGYNSQIQGYSSQIQGYSAQTQAYMGQVQAKNAEWQGYSSQIQGFTSQMQGYTAQAQAFAAKVQAKNAEWQGYNSQIQGYNSQMQGYSAQAQAFASQAQVYKTKIDSQVSRLQGVTAKNAGIADGYRAKMSGYIAKIQGESARVSGEIDLQRQNSTNFNNLLNYGTTKYNQQITYYSAESRRILEEAREKYGLAAKQAELFIELGKASSGLYAKIGDAHAQMAASALSGINTLAAEVQNI